MLVSMFWWPESYTLVAKSEWVEVGQYIPCPLNISGLNISRLFRARWLVGIQVCLSVGFCHFAYQFLHHGGIWRFLRIWYPGSIMCWHYNSRCIITTCYYPSCLFGCRNHRWINCRVPIPFRSGLTLGFRTPLRLRWSCLLCWSPTRAPRGRQHVWGTVSLPHC